MKYLLLSLFFIAGCSPHLTLKCFTERGQKELVKVSSVTKYQTGEQVIHYGLISRRDWLVFERRHVNK